jgi:uncharacterized protein (TIGR02147 family)
MPYGYRDTLLSEYQKRIQRNPAYSLRAFSRDIGVPASNLCNVLHKKRGLSLMTAKRIAQNMGMQGDEEKHFLALVQREHGRSTDERKQAQRTLKNLNKTEGFGELSLDRFELIANWIYFAILELTHVADFKSDSDWIAKRLGVERSEVEMAVGRLLKLGLLECTDSGRLRETPGDVTTPTTDIPSRFLKEHHQQILAKAASALGTVAVEQREFAAITMAIDSRQMPAAKKYLRDFRRLFAKDM